VKKEPGKIHGRIQFDVSPGQCHARREVHGSIHLANEDRAHPVTDMVVTTTINGQKRSGPVPPQARDVAPRQKALLLATPDVWKEDTTAWAMEVIVRTARGETYKNYLSWK
jgi:hypothetical protein